MLYSRIKIYLCTKRFIYISTITIIIINTNNNINRIRFGLSITSKQCIFSFLNGSWMANIDFKVMLSWFHTKWACFRVPMAPCCEMTIMAWPQKILRDIFHLLSQVFNLGQVQAATSTDSSQSRWLMADVTVVRCYLHDSQTVTAA